MASDVQKFVVQVATTYDKLNVCFNNGGVTLEKTLPEYSAAEWDDVINTGLRGSFLALKDEIPYLVERDGGRSS